jgi:enamine deaminase RidA (YjgF/YER057c/UK114 family)
MNKQTIGGKSAQGLPFSKAVRAGDFVYLSGQMAHDISGQFVDGSIEAQTRQVFENIESVLKLAGCKMKDIVKVNVWLDDARDF